jgi:predicted protein tyrosine phosphatase
VIYVCGLDALEEHARRLRPEHVVSLVAPEEQPPTPDGVSPDRHLRIEIHDISQPMPGYILPEEDHVATLIDLFRERRTGSAILIHCLAGISRSTAAALIALAVEHEGLEKEAALRLRAAAPHADPNRRMIALADMLLGRDGRLIAAREGMGPAGSFPMETLFRVPLELG